MPILESEATSVRFTKRYVMRHIAKVRKQEKRAALVTEIAKFKIESEH